MRFLWKMILKEIWQRLSNLNSEIRRGDLYYADLSPVVGSEQGGVRPVLVIQNNIGNKYSPTIIIAAITSQINKAKLPTHIEISANEYGLNKDSVILLEQIRTIDKKSDTFDFTVISQTTKERLFFFPYLLQRWKGPLSIAIMTNVTDTEEIETFIQSSNFPDRLRLALYITGLPGKTDCVYRRTSRGLRCVRATIYPLNRLRNIAIQNSLTSHFVVFDMDMWPASFSFRSLSLPEHTLPTPSPSPSFPPSRCPQRSWSPPSVAPSAAASPPSPRVSPRPSSSSCIACASVAAPSSDRSR